MKQPTINEVAAMFGITVDQARAQYAANAKQLRECQAKAEQTGKVYRGYTAEQWKERAEHFEHMAKS